MKILYLLLVASIIAPSKRQATAQQQQSNFETMILIQQAEAEVQNPTKGFDFLTDEENKSLEHILANHFLELQTIIRTEEKTLSAELSTQQTELFSQNQVITQPITSDIMDKIIKNFFTILENKDKEGIKFLYNALKTGKLADIPKNLKALSAYTRKYVLMQKGLYKNSFDDKKKKETYEFLIRQYLSYSTFLSKALTKKVEKIKNLCTDKTQLQKYLEQHVYSKYQKIYEKFHSFFLNLFFPQQKTGSDKLKDTNFYFVSAKNRFFIEVMDKKDIFLFKSTAYIRPIHPDYQTFFYPFSNGKSGIIANLTNSLIDEKIIKIVFYNGIDTELPCTCKLAEINKADLSEEDTKLADSLFKHNHEIFLPFNSKEEAQKLLVSLVYPHVLRIRHKKTRAAKKRINREKRKQETKIVEVLDDENEVVTEILNDDDQTENHTETNSYSEDSEQEDDYDFADEIIAEDEKILREICPYKEEKAYQNWYDKLEKEIEQACDENALESYQEIWEQFRNPKQSNQETAITQASATSSAINTRTKHTTGAMSKKEMKEYVKEISQGQIDLANPTRKGKGSHNIYQLEQGSLPIPAHKTYKQGLIHAITKQINEYKSSTLEKTIATAAADYINHYQAP